MLFSIIRGPSYEQARAAISRSGKLDGIELRLDCFESFDLPRIQSLLQECPIPVLLTLRKASHGGHFAQSEEAREALLEKLLSLSPQYIDFEYDMRPDFIQRMAKKYPKTKIITSYHNFEETPDLKAIWKKIQNPCAFAYKIATMGKSTLDSLKMLHFMQAQQKAGNRFIGIVMGESGQITRILGPIFGNFIDYSLLEAKEATAPGQLLLDDLLNIYRYRSLNGQTQIFSLIGDPVDKSVGHIAHNKAFQELHCNAVYVKMQIKPEEIEGFFSQIKGLPFKGLSVTMPLKESLFPFLQNIDPDAQKIGAINTLLIESGAIEGTNTDGRGALDAIEKKEKVNGKKIVVLGAGGAAKGIAFEAKKRGAELLILNRTAEKALALAGELECRGGGLDSLGDEKYDMIINTTPDEMPIDPQFILPHKLAMDIKTRPKDTAFLLEAAKRDCVLVYGYEMWINQAVLQWKAWFKDKYDLSKVEAVIEKATLAALN